MWLLSYVAGDGNLLEGKRRWLRPGTGHLFGRTSSKPATGERCVYIGDKNISRKHTTFRVASPTSGSSTRLQKRTTVTIIDESKKGTLIDGENPIDCLTAFKSFNNYFDLETRTAVLAAMTVSKD